MNKPSDEYTAEYSKIVNNFFAVLGLPEVVCPMVPMPRLGREADTLAALRRGFNQCLESWPKDKYQVTYTVAGHGFMRVAMNDLTALESYVSKDVIEIHIAITDPQQ